MEREKRSTVREVMRKKGKGSENTSCRNEKEWVVKGRHGGEEIYGGRGRERGRT